MKENIVLQVHYDANKELHKQVEALLPSNEELKKQIDARVESYVDDVLVQVIERHIATNPKIVEHFLRKLVEKEMGTWYVEGKIRNLIVDDIHDRISASLKDMVIDITRKEV